MILQSSSSAFPLIFVLKFSSSESPKNGSRHFKPSIKTIEIIIRKAKEADTEKIWTLMEQLAVFEKHIDTFGNYSWHRQRKWFLQKSTRFLLLCNIGQR